MINLTVEQKKAIDNINYNFYVAADLYKGRERINKTNDFINTMIYNCIYIVLLQLLDFIEQPNSNNNKGRYKDSVTFPRKYLSEEEQKQLKDFVDKYKYYRNKHLAHVTYDRTISILTIQELRSIIDIINFHAIVEYYTNCDRIVELLTNQQ